MEENDIDALLESLAMEVEETSLRDHQGVLAKRKRDREDANLRAETMRSERAYIAEFIRSKKSNRARDAVMVLRDISERSSYAPPHDAMLSDAWPLALHGWLDIFCVVRCTANEIPPPTHYSITITDLGRKVLASARTGSTHQRRDTA